MLKHPTAISSSPHLAILAILALAASLTACGGGSSNSSSRNDASDPMQSFRNQTLAWGACDATLLDDHAAALAKQLGSRMQCVDMRVPKDWGNPESGMLSISVLRVAAGDAKERRGALAFNPGGPGTDGLLTGLAIFSILNGSDPASEQGALQLQVLKEYDFIGFSPRGMGARAQLDCDTEAIERFVDFSPSGALTPANWQNALTNSREMTQACKANPLTPFINSDATARDMDLLRELLGDAKLNYFGYSYGTWLGGWYASLFPDKVGRMVLDSSMDFTGTHESATLAMAPARQRIHEQILLPYAARHPDFFNLGTNAAEIDAMIKAMSPQMLDLLGALLGGKTYRSRDADNYLGVISAARGLDAVLAQVSDPASISAVKSALAAYTFVPNNAQRDDAVRADALEIYEELYSPRWLMRTDDQLEVMGGYWAVSCNDTQSLADDAAWLSIMTTMVQQTPLYISGVIQNPCTTWGASAVIKPNIAAMSGLDILTIQSQFDGATPAEGANRYFAKLNSAKRVNVPGEYSHAVFPYADNCIDANVVRYLLGESPKARETSCAAKPLPQDPKLQPTTISAYLNPEQAQAQIDEFKNRIGAGRR